MCEWHFFQWDAAVAQMAIAGVSAIVVTWLIVNRKRTSP